MKPSGVGFELLNHNTAKQIDSARSDFDKYQMIRNKINQDSRKLKASEIRSILVDPLVKKPKNSRRVIWTDLPDYK